MLNFVAIDLETTGLNPETCQILEIGALSSTGESFHAYVKWNLYQGEGFALAHNSGIIKECEKLSTDALEGLKVSNIDVAIIRLNDFIIDLSNKWGGGRVTVAGKNFAAFDLPFLKRAGFETFRIHHRYLDVGNLFWTPSDNQIPDLATCLGRMGIKYGKFGEMSHSALEDAALIVDAIKWIERAKGDPKLIKD